jgi:hypothetical protein
LLVGIAAETPSVQQAEKVVVVASYKLLEAVHVGIFMKVIKNFNLILQASCLLLHDVCDTATPPNIS